MTAGPGRSPREPRGADPAGRDAADDRYADPYEPPYDPSRDEETRRYRREPGIPPGPYGAPVERPDDGFERPAPHDSGPYPPVPRPGRYESPARPADSYEPARAPGAFPAERDGHPWDGRGSDLSRQDRYAPDVYPGEHPADPHPADRHRPADQYPADRYPADQYPADRYPADRYRAEQSPAGGYEQARYPADGYGPREPERYGGARYDDARYDGARYDDDGRRRPPPAQDRYGGPPQPGHYPEDPYEPGRYRPQDSFPPRPHGPSGSDGYRARQHPADQTGPDRAPPPPRDSYRDQYPPERDPEREYGSAGHRLDRYPDDPRPPGRHPDDRNRGDRYPDDRYPDGGYRDRRYPDDEAYRHGARPTTRVPTGTAYPGASATPPPPGRGDQDAGGRAPSDRDRDPRGSARPPAGEQTRKLPSMPSVPPPSEGGPAQWSGRARTPAPAAPPRGTPPGGTPPRGSPADRTGRGGRPRAGSGGAAARPAGKAGAKAGAAPAKRGGLGRASGTMAIGTIASRASGFLRTVAIAAAIGTGAVGDAFNVANTTPNIIYDLLVGGILTSVVVPVLVRASKEDPDGGDSFASSLITLMVLLLGAAVALGMFAAPQIINLYLDAGEAEKALGTSFLRWFLPQIVFYGLGATIGAILNARQSFAAPMFAPVLNNLIVIATCLVFIVIPGPRPPTTTGMTDTQTVVLAGGTTLGVVVMTIALLPSLRTVGFRYRPRLDLRHPGLRTASRLAGWTLLYVLISQVGYLVIVRLSSGSTAYTVYTYGYQIFQLPYAIIGVSVITALLPRMSGHAAAGQAGLVREDLSTATRMTVTAIVPSALFLLALGRPIAVAVFNHGAVGYGEAMRIGDTLSAFAIALVPFSLFQVQLRAFYAYQDSRTPALVNIGVVATNVVAALGLSQLVAEEHRAVALALAFSLAYLIGLAVTTFLLRRRLFGIDGNRIARVTTRVSVTAGIGAVLASVIAEGLRDLLGHGWIGSGVAVVLGLAVGGVVFVVVSVRTGMHEMTVLMRMVGGRLGVGRRAAPATAAGGGASTRRGTSAGRDRTAARGRTAARDTTGRDTTGRDTTGRDTTGRGGPPRTGRDQPRGRGGSGGRSREGGPGRERGHGDGGGGRDGRGRPPRGRG